MINIIILQMMVIQIILHYYFTILLSFGFLLCIQVLYNYLYAHSQNNSQIDKPQSNLISTSLHSNQYTFH